MTEVHYAKCPRLSQGIAWREKEKVLCARGYNPEKQRQSCPEKKRRVVGEEPGSNGISVLVSNGNDLAIQLHVEPTS